MGKSQLIGIVIGLIGMHTDVMAEQLAINVTEEANPPASSVTTENRKTTIPYKTVSNNQEVDQSKVLFKSELASVFPLFGHSLKEQGYHLPLPFGVGLSNMNQEQGLNVSNVAVDFYPSQGEIDVNHVFQVPKS